MTAAPQLPIATVISFIDCINRRDLRGLARLMADDHRLEIFDETPVVGRNANAKAWAGYFRGFPNYVIHPRRLAERGSHVAVLGHTTGSHLRLPDEEESKETLIWVAHVAEGRLRVWRLVRDAPANRRAHGLDAA
jgi:ketosteroid isomerase-like protein